MMECGVRSLNLWSDAAKGLITKSSCRFVMATLSSMNKRQIMLIVSIAAILIVVLATILTYNSLVRKEQGVERTWGNIEAAYQMRIDKIPLVLSAVNSSMTFEKSLLENITLLRTQWLSEVGKDVAANVNTTQQLDSKISALLLAINENYPTLRSIQVVQDFIAIVDETENIILAQRVFYNDSVASYNSAVRGFPGNLFGFSEAQYYQRGQ